MASPNQLSFLPDDYLERKIQRRTNAICAILFIIVISGIGSAFAVMEKSVRAVDAQAAAVHQQYLSEASRLQQVRQMQEKQRRMSHQAELTASLLERVPRSFILAEITNSLPGGVSLLDLSMESRVRTRPAPAAPALTTYEQKKQAREAAAGGASAAPPVPEAKVYDVTLKLVGVATTDVQVAQLISRLSRSPLFREVNLVISDEYTLAKEKEKYRKFQLDMTINTDVDVQTLEQRQTQTTSVEVMEEN